MSAQPSEGIFSFREGWKARGRELNDIYTALGRVVREQLGRSGPPNGRYERDAVEDIEALGSEVARMREALVEVLDWMDHIEGEDGIRRSRLHEQVAAALGPREGNDA